MSGLWICYVILWSHYHVIKTTSSTFGGICEFSSPWLTSPRVVQTASHLVRELAICELAYPWVVQLPFADTPLYEWMCLGSRGVSGSQNTAQATLLQQLTSKIRFNGPVTVADYMKEVLTNSVGVRFLTFYNMWKFACCLLKLLR